MISTRQPPSGYAPCVLRAFTAVVCCHTRIVLAACSLCRAFCETFMRCRETQSLCRAACASVLQRALTSSPGISKFAPLSFVRVLGAQNPVLPPAPFVRQQPCCRLLRSCRFDDFSGSHLSPGWAMLPSPAPTLGFMSFCLRCLSTALAPRHAHTLRSVPLAAGVPPLTAAPASWLCVHGAGIPSRRWFTAFASLQFSSILLSRRSAARGPRPATSGYCAVCESVASSARAKKRPILPWAFHLHGWKSRPADRALSEESSPSSE